MEDSPQHHSDHHHEHNHNHPQQQPSSSPPTTGTCCKCGGPTTFAPPPPSPSFTSPPPTYRPIRAPAIPPDPNSPRTITLPHHFLLPTKRIQSPDDIRRFHSSASGQNFLGFVAALSASVRACKISDPCHQSPATLSLLSLLQTLIQFADDTPPLPQPARFGNVAFRSWHEKMSSAAESLILPLLPEPLRDAAAELVPYFTDSFGNASRIDYGTGHETNFAAFLYCLARLAVIEESDYPAVVVRVFVKYLELMRKLQLQYCLEPAGSHGVWGLDDYHFLPFIFGSSQLIDHKYMKPKSIHNTDILENFSNEYLYLACIAFVKKVKKGVFAEHSPMLDDISGVPSWSKVNSGLLKMYKAEVLEKVPIMQHFLFGSLINWYV
uniref:Serine/threonine-protein phosphatase 2A activator n=1 Tax=Cajanus cajan TaxID=3821 RepID=A0A151TNX3_CAJCA|nr:Serine/threonine-protein phosphatase 2A regulatory subunit B' [Cajanus cajan]